MKQRTRHTPNVYIDAGEYYEMVLFESDTAGCGEVARTKISKDMLPVVANYKWGLDGRGYVRNRKIKLHQLILGKKQGYEIDHINGDILDNRNENLRHVTHERNMRGEWNRKSGKVRGIHWDKQRAKWKAEICVAYKNRHLGRFDTFEDAIEARREAEIKYWGHAITKSI